MDSQGITQLLICMLATLPVARGVFFCQGSFLNLIEKCGDSNCEVQRSEFCDQADIKT